MLPTTNYKAGDIVLALVPFVDSDGYKKRPVVIVSNDTVRNLSDHYIAAAISSQVRQPVPDSDVLIRGAEVASAGLIAESVVRSTLLVSISETRISRKVGRMPTGPWKRTMAKVCAYFPCAE